ncbi:MAG: hypothetical protein C0599_16565 [Salinivirgaceae bacterium]|nr:MAG: hypothetical protein C0599_16565 [Salinivirgaceae bacterium]
MKALFYIFIFVLTVSSVSGQEGNNIRFKGFVDTYHSAKIESPNDLISSRSRLRVELDKINGNSYFFVSLNAVHNNVLPEFTGIQFREAYLEYTEESWGFKAGRQIIVWGKADGLRITDVISPMDLTEFLAQDYDDIRMPVNGIVLSKFSTNWNLDLICIPIMEGYILPGADNPWGTDYASLGIVEDEAQKPKLNLSNMEYGGKLSFYLSGIDFDLSALHTFNKAPVYSFNLDSTNLLHMTPEYNRVGFVGLGFAKSLNAFVLRGEGAFYFDKNFTPDMTNYTEGIQKSNSINYLLGLDWYPGGDWTFTGQFSDEYIMDYSKNIALNQHNYISTIGISKKILQSTVTLSTFAYIGLNDGDFYNRSSIDYSISDNIHVMTGYDWFYGDKGLFGQYKDNTQVWVKAKYSF